MRTSEFLPLASAATIRRWIKSGQLPARRVGKRWDVALTDVLEIVSRRAAAKPRAYLAYLTTFRGSGRPSGERSREVVVTNPEKPLHTLLMEVAPMDADSAIVGLFESQEQADAALALAWRAWTYQADGGWIQWRP